MGKIAGNGNWDDTKQFLNINIGSDTKFIELEYFEIIPQLKSLPSKRIIRAVYGVGSYISN